MYATDFNLTENLLIILNGLVLFIGVMKFYQLYNARDVSPKKPDSLKIKEEMEKIKQKYELEGLRLKNDLIKKQYESDLKLLRESLKGGAKNVSKGFVFK